VLNSYLVLCLLNISGHFVLKHHLVLFENMTRPLCFNQLMNVADVARRNSSVLIPKI
jgi:hypothetical protein